ncbi:Beta and beta-prime subunits of DNA dependent RNA-polymerase [Mycena kentingensis (nom. inval.)]|nr:Beta and beta-prime subunits of DNA dependent RNA-polymerase [Mycena kentingensis (nom. inval.)]
MCAPKQLKACASRNARPTKYEIGSTLADTGVQYGWAVERHLKDGDSVLFNRRPSLHKLVPRQIISLQADKPVIGTVQTTMCGIRKVTLRDTFLDWNQVQNILLRVQDWDGSVLTPAIVKPKPLWAGKQILSLLIPSLGEEDSRMTIRESFESLVEPQLNVARDDSGQFAEKNLKEDTNVEEMVNVEGRRIPFGFKHRTLPHFTKDDFGPEAGGFIESSYLRGLSRKSSSSTRWRDEKV